MQSVSFRRALPCRYINYSQRRVHPTSHPLLCEYLGIESGVRLNTTTRSSTAAGGQDVSTDLDARAAAIVYGEQQVPVRSECDIHHDSDKAHELDGVVKVKVDALALESRLGAQSVHVRDGEVIPFEPGGRSVKVALGVDSP